jgi:hypothetical protein
MKTKFLLSTLFASFWLISNLNAQTPTLEWAKNMGGIGYDEAYSISTDTIGNVYDTGTFEGTVDFDPGAGTKNITSTAPTDIFILKLDANGNFQWVKYMGGGEFNNSYSVVTDIGGNVYTVGVFSETADFDPGAGTMNLTSNGLSDIFIQKLDTGGDLLWVKQMGGI